MTSRMAVVDIESEAAFDKTISSAGSSLVIVDYSTTWCGPCKVIAPKFDEFSDKYPGAVFLKVRGWPPDVNCEIYRVVFFYGLILAFLLRSSEMLLQMLPS